MGKINISNDERMAFIIYEQTICEGNKINFQTIVDILSKLTAYSQKDLSQLKELTSNNIDKLLDYSIFKDNCEKIDGNWNRFYFIKDTAYLLVQTLYQQKLISEISNNITDITKTYLVNNFEDKAKIYLDIKTLYKNLYAISELEYFDLIQKSDSETYKEETQFAYSLTTTGKNVINYSKLDAEQTQDDEQIRI